MRQQITLDVGGELSTFNFQKGRKTLHTHAHTHAQAHTHTHIHREIERYIDR